MTLNDMYVQCCLCGNMIVQSEFDPLTLKLAVDKSSEQELFCHYRCLKRAVDPSVPLYPFEDVRT